MKVSFKPYKLICQLLVLVLSFCVVGNVAAFASDEGIMPCYNNTNTTSTNFTVSSTGTATASVGYTGYSGVTTGARIETKIQKKVLGVFWQNVNAGTWIDSASGASYHNTHRLNLTSKGTYRVIVKYQIRGAGGATDDIESTIERTY